MHSNMRKVNIYLLGTHLLLLTDQMAFDQISQILLGVAHILKMRYLLVSDTLLEDISVVLAFVPGFGHS